ncbi:GNAT family N-acetyltransferase [Tabrizicola sp.]|uniref:GNAT family N-acetyltransferase n=1 Tax=Tabrizicola sp. TaxID=2005166 RepID=UPI003F3EC270
MTLAFHIPTLTTARLTLRGPGPQDFPGQAAFLASDRARFVGGPLAERLAWRALASMIGHWAMRGFGMWAVTLQGSDRAIGLVGLYFPIDWPEREIGWHIWDPACEGKGYATEAATAAREHAFGTLGWDTAVSYIDPDNIASRRVAERLGAIIDETAQRPGPTDVVYRHRRAA